MQQELPDPLRRRLLDAGVEVVHSRRLPGDVSTRRYFRARLDDGDRVVVAAYPPDDREDPCRRWLATTGLLEEAGVAVPRIVASDCEGGWMVLEDVGQRNLYEVADGWDGALGRLPAALAAIREIERLDPLRVAAVNPDLDGSLLARELRQTIDLVLEPRSLLGDDRQARRLLASLAELVENLVALPTRPCHRDYMARNLMPTDAEGVIVLDHQDLRLGPPFYDLASLLNDSFFADPGLESEALAEMGLDDGDRSQYHRAAGQRCLKIAGTFEAFRQRGEDRHVRLIEPALACAVRHLGALPETAAAIGDVRSRWPARTSC